MKIGIEAQRIFRKNKHGMEIVAVELIRELQKIDYKNEYVIFVRDGEDNQCISATDNFRIMEIPAFSYADWEQWKLPRILKKEGIDLLHCTANTAPMYLKVPTVLTLHDIIYLESIDFSGSTYQNFGNLYRRYVVPRGAKKSKIITVSEYEKSRISEMLKIDKEGIEVIYNAINPQFEVKESNEEMQRVLSKYGLPESFLLFFGNTAPKKNTVRVLDAFCQYCELNPLKIVPLVITDCSIDYISGKLKELGCLRLMKHIHVKDYVLFSDLPYVYNAAKVFLYPSLRESFGMPIIEAMACGTPVITSNSSSMPEIAGNAALLVNPLKPDQIARYIFDVLNNNKLYESLVRLGLENVKRFSWHNAAKQLVGVYEEAMIRLRYSRAQNMLV